MKSILNLEKDSFKVNEGDINIGISVKKGNTELCDIVDADLTKLAEDGTIAKLAEKYDISDLICIGK